jgi:hypothetical protein
VALRKKVKTAIWRICLTGLAAVLTWLGLRWGIGAVGIAVACLAGLVFYGAFLSIFIFTARGSAAQRRVLATLAAENGWTYWRRADKVLQKRLSSYVPPDGATSVYVTDVLTGTVRGWAFAAFGCTKSYPTGVQDPDTGRELTSSTFDSLVVLEGLPVSASGHGGQNAAPMPSHASGVVHRLPWLLSEGTLHVSGNPLGVNPESRSVSPGKLPSVVTSLADIADRIREQGSVQGPSDPDPR